MEKALGCAEKRFPHWLKCIFKQFFLKNGKEFSLIDRKEYIARFFSEKIF